MQLGDGVVFELENVRVLDHPYPLFLLGGDVVKCGRNKDRWVCYGVDWRPDGSGVVGELKFVRDGTLKLCPLAFCPDTEGTRFQAPGLLALVQDYDETASIDGSAAPIGG